MPSQILNWGVNVKKSLRISRAVMTSPPVSHLMSDSLRRQPCPVSDAETNRAAFSPANPVGCCSCWFTVNKLESATFAKSPNMSEITLSKVLFPLLPVPCRISITCSAVDPVSVYPTARCKNGITSRCRRKIRFRNASKVGHFASGS